jgi:protoporphyrinogen oxidase
MSQAEKKHVLIIGAGPAGLTVGAELVKAGYRVTVFEKDPAYVGGLARTVQHNGFRFDIGGHRFFSKNPLVTAWWRERLPGDFLKVRRLSRIYYDGKYFNYPLKALNAFWNLGSWTSFRCLASYIRARLFPVMPETSFQDWVSNRFGKVLFELFFKTYTEKVWGTPCDQISADWAAQRIRNLSIASAIGNALRPGFLAPKTDIKTLIEEFEYPRMGPGMMWENVRDGILAAGGSVLMGHDVIALNHKDGRIVSVTARDMAGQERSFEADYVIATCPLRETVCAFHPSLPSAVVEAAQRLRYRDFITVIVIIEKDRLFPDQWIYVHSPEVKLGRIQNFNNWSPFMVPAPGVTCLGLEYFCNEGDETWSASEQTLVALAKRELGVLGLLGAERVLDTCVVRMPKTYPVYTPDYAETVQTIRDHLAPFKNLQVIGRNGMHKYNNQDHAMMTAMFAAKNIRGETWDIWRVNADAEYLEDGNRETSLPHPS